ncbi:Uncharacterized protein OS=Isosphaera pallida (strain ATCC 43644 / DSM 9630 / IS1B) GN=Isop_3540 PE=4 SV=1 [Gemmataceae bacterium]|nr:Uncharacterized protein OS=Isosphaera pallida (strain ATCC 43644 / DSM 9630 / IS1B) GN=Isop_3540 PE=4 SV=1 [Gemmataceae bacterium]VTT98509.1 Uncharacterized protein OS=Isosphaera pallida (strain ATCC 43644 / DSM 9630 / IS1B) GN=Isop_3540 PE=4 SV=1 [Gemmataceae bacterium]
MALVLRPPTSGESLTDTLGDLGRTRKLVALAAGVLGFVAATTGAALLACALDAAVSLPPLARALALAGTLALGGVVWLRGVSRSLALRSDALSIALELEEKYPELNDALASAVSFLEAEDPAGRGVSPHLEQAAVRSAHRAANRYNLDRLVPSGKCWRAVWACAAVAAAAVPLAIAGPERATVAVTRLADPFGNHPWPTRTRVQVLVPAELPARMPKGEAFDLKLVVRGVIKDRAVVTFRVFGGEEFEEQYPLAIGNDPKFPGAAVVAARVEAARVQGPFAFKIASNDYESEWLRVDVVPPPRLVPLPGPGGGRPSPRFRVRPPAYTGLPELDLPDGASVLEIPVGTVVTVNATSDVRLATAALAFTGDRSVVGQAAGLTPVGHLIPFAAAAAEELANGIGADVPLAIDATGRGLSTVFAPSMSGTYAFRLTDETGLTGTRLVEIRLLPDPAPTVALLRPGLGRDPQVLTPTANLAAHVAADDKVYAVRRTFLEYRVGRDGPVRVVPLLDAGSVEGLAAVAGGPGALARVRPTATEAVRSVPLAALTRDGTNPLRDGDSVFVRGAADDWDDVTPVKEPGRSPEFEIRIATPESVEAWLERELAAMRPDLIRVRNQQREARQKAGETVPQADGSLVPADRDRLLAAEQTQRLLRGKISDPADGLRAKADVLLETVRVNALPRSNTTDRVAVVAEALGRLSDRDLPVIEPTLTEARQIGGQPARVGQAGVVPEFLRKAARHQKAVEDGLTDLLDLLAVWGGAVEIRGEARVLRDFVQRQREEVEKLGPDPAASDLDRAGTRAEQASEQANQLLTRAGRLAAEKDREAARHRRASEEKKQEAAKLRESAAELPPGALEKSAAGARATLIETEAEELKAAADKAVAEAGALRKAVAAADGQGLPEGLRDAAGKLRKDNRSLAGDQLRTAVGRLDRMIEALSERVPEAAPDLAKRKRAADSLDALAAAQDDIRRRSAEAAQIADPVARAAELKRLAAEQDKLIERGKDLLQRLTLDRAERPARDVRAALDSMEAARGDLESGNSGVRPQNDAVDRLDSARDRLDAAAASAPQQLSDEKRRKMAERLQALLDRQKAAVAEAERVHKLVASGKEWSRDALTAYGDLAEKRQQPIADELRPVEKDFAPLPVLARVVADATGAMDRAAKQITGRLEDADPALAFDPVLEAENDRKVLRPMRLAQRRLEQLLEALKQDDPKPAPKSDGPPPANPMNQQPPAGGGGDRDLVPPQAQLKVLRSLQAELNERTAEFAKSHPDAAKLTDDERAELKQLEDAQREMAALFEQIAKLFQDAKRPDAEPPAPPEKPAAPETEKP